uniref:Uncharacterized protein n=1 Tax=Caenorhabditis japonica TaxID=281687 RepID=A0A8R1EMQ4_CAEJA
MIFVLVIVSLLIACISYSGVLLSWILSFVTKLEIKVESVAMCRLNNISVKISDKLALHIEVASLSRDKAHPTSSQK